jgi:16S rRNA (guanine966-N2)-methyltransferase
MVKISAGSCRGRILLTGTDKRVRPTTGRVKEALFSMIAAKITQAHVLDLFSGSGNLGLEALSRGAASAVFVDNNKKSLAMIRENIKRCGFTDQTTLLSGSALQEKLYTCLEQPQTRGFDLVFLDPPYEQGMAQTALNHLATADFLEPGAVIVTEEAENVTVSMPSEWNQLQSRGYGDTRITIWTR